MTPDQLRNQNLAVFELRGELANVKKFIESGNKVALKAALRACYQDAKTLFGKGDLVGKDLLSSWKTDLRSVYNHFNAGDSKLAFEETKELYSRICVHAIHLADINALPESAAEAMSEVYFEMHSEGAEEGSSKFDLAAGNACEKHFGGSPVEPDDL